MVYEKLISGQYKLAVIGLGYVGLPIALSFAKKIKVIGFDIDEQRIELLNKKVDSTGELTTEHFANTNIEFSADTNVLKDACIYIVAVPTPIDKSTTPDLHALKTACKTVGKYLKKDDIVVFESTVYPGCTEEECVPILEHYSNLHFLFDFKVAYSPERINPGDIKHTLENVVKIVAACDKSTQEEVARIYELVVVAGIFKAKTIRVAEAAKVIENTQRDINIALINELSIIFNRLDINTYDVLEAASTKWNFLKFSPGLVGGHCIGVDPYYLTHKAMLMGYHPKVITSGRYVNESMGFYIGKQTVKKILAKGKNIHKAKVLVMGATFKENIRDIRNSKVVDIVNELKSFQVSVDVVDPHASPQDMLEEYNISLITTPTNDYDAVIIAVNHKEYNNLTENDIRTLFCDDKGIIVDVKGILHNKILKTEYWSL